MKCVASIVAVLACLVVLPLHAQIPQFQHIIVVVQENRTPDNLFQDYVRRPMATASRAVPTLDPTNTTFRPRSGATTRTPEAIPNPDWSTSGTSTIWITLTWRS